MANNKKNTKAVAAIAIIYSLSAFATAKAETEYTKNNTSIYFSAPAISRSVLSYLSSPIPVLASIARAGITIAAPITTDRNSQQLQAMAPSARMQELPVTQAALRPSSPPTFSPAAKPGAAAFDTVAIPFKRLAALSKFAPSLDEMENGSAISCSGKTCNAAIEAIKLASNGSGSQSSIRDKLNSVNAAVNAAIRYKPDQETNGVADYWSPPSETLKRQQGDCEDFAILKMAALRADGVDPSLMSIVVLFDQKRHFYHAVLSVEVSGRHYILDNMRNQVLQDTQLPDYLPLYSIRDGKGYLHGSQRQKQVASAATMPLEKIAPGEGVGF